MEQEINISLRFKLVIGKVSLNEIVYRLKEIRDPLILNVLAEILKGYDGLISERLSQTWLGDALDKLDKYSLVMGLWGWGRTKLTNLNYC